MLISIVVSATFVCRITLYTSEGVLILHARAAHFIERLPTGTGTVFSPFYAVR
jgi:hypothetical protein